MTTQELINKLTARFEDNRVFDLVLSPETSLRIYPKSINRAARDFLFLARSDQKKYLFVVSADSRDSLMPKLEGKLIAENDFSSGTTMKRCRMNHHNASVIRELFDFTRPRLIGLQNSIGLGDRLGIANPAHLRALRGSSMKPILAQQSIRELERTQRKPEEVLDAATWAVFQEGYKDGFGADADHLKTTDDIDLLVKAGFTMFTIDPGEFVVNEADTLPLAAATEQIRALPWAVLEDDLDGFLARYQDCVLDVAEDLRLQPSRDEVLRGLLKYGRVIAHTVAMYRYLKATYPDHPAEFELSVDETDSVTSPFEHYLVANELKRLGVELVSLAPRFVGDFEKGIDYRGDLDQFVAEYKKHLKIAARLGPYKISFHSGSDKFKVYEAVGKLPGVAVHVKTAGTSYLEALRTVATTSPLLFREILDFARGLYEQEKRTYHVSAELEKVLPAEQYTDEQLTSLFSQDDARQVLHVTFGKVLTETDPQGQSRFRDRIMKCLSENEETHYDFLCQHFIRHLSPFEKAK